MAGADGVDDGAELPIHATLAAAKRNRPFDRLPELQHPAFARRPLADCRKIYRKVEVGASTL